ncbi:MAG: FkbM family methyltransferase, partial [Planctomycetota bacterium]
MSVPDRVRPSIGIVTPSYNQASYIEAMLASVAEQSVTPVEHLILDGGSSDGSRERIEAYAEGRDHVSAVFEPDDGQVDAINAGLARCTADVLTWLNTDDIYTDPDVLRAVQDEFARRPELDVVYARGRFIDADGEFLRNVYVNPDPDALEGDLAHSIGILQPAAFFRRRVFERFGPLDTSIQYSFDYEYWARIACGGARFGFLDRYLVDATLHDESKTGGQRGRQYLELAIAARKHYGFTARRWLHRWAEFKVAGVDGILKGSGDVGSDEADAVDRALGELQREWNGSRDAQRRLLSRRGARSGAAASAAGQAVDETVEDLRGRGLIDTDRLIVTSFNAAYFRQGLNLIASLQRLREDAFSFIVVFDLGLTDQQREELARYERVIVADYPEDVRGAFDGYLSPKNYSYKCSAIRAAGEFASDGDRVLWIDAGVAVLSEIDEIFALIERDGAFFVDHDDKPGWPLRNSTFTHPEAARRMGATADELLAPHLCSCLLGYVKAGSQQALIDEAYKYSLDEKVVAWPKHLPKSEQRTVQQVPPKLRKAYERAVEDASARARLGAEGVLESTAYLGHRQDQTIYSILCARHGVPQHSATRFCRSNDASSHASLANWKSGGEAEGLRRFRHHAMPPGVLTYHHRGIYDKLDGLRESGRAETLVILGNGPSLREVDLAGLGGADTLGMNAAYRHWDRIGWYPTHYCCMDTVVIMSHADEIARMVRDRRALGMRRFFLRTCILETQPQLRDEPSVTFLEDVQEASELLSPQGITTGSFSALFGAFMGYRRMVLLGIDCDYVEKIDQAKAAGGIKLAITETPKANPNYFFDDYQQKGDLYNIPNASPGFHPRAWSQAERVLTEAGVRVFNGNPASKLRVFPFAMLDEVSGRDSAPQTAPRSGHAEPVGGEFGRSAKARIDELAYIAKAIGTAHADDLMVDVGTHHGGSLKPFLDRGWRVLGFEPDPDNRAQLHENVGTPDRLIVDERALSDAPAEAVSFYSTGESSGASSLAAFTAGHEEAATVEVTTLDRALAEHGVQRVRLLKIDAEGFDLRVLEGCPWDRVMPDAVMVEFEDSKTLPIGYSTADMADYLVGRGYTVFCSEWHPIVRYGIAHDWRRMFRWGSEAHNAERPSGASWGNLIAFRYDADADAFERLVHESVVRGELTRAAVPREFTVPDALPGAAPTTRPQTAAAATASYPRRPRTFAQRIREIERASRAAASAPVLQMQRDRLVRPDLPWAPREAGPVTPVRHAAWTA